MPSRRRPAPRRIVGVHSTRPRPAKPRAAPRRPATAAKARGVPREFRDPSTLPTVKDRCGWRECTSGPFFARPDQEYCCPAHRLKAWRERQPARSPAVPLQDLPHVVDMQGLPAVDVDGLDYPDLEDPRVAGDDDGLDDHRRRALQDPEFRAWARQWGLL